MPRKYTVVARKYRIVIFITLHIVAALLIGMRVRTGILADGNLRREFLSRLHMWWNC